MADIDYVLARLETDELVIGEWYEDILRKCLVVEIMVDEVDKNKFTLGFCPVFDYLSDAAIDIDTDLIVYKTDKINPDVLSQYKTIVNSMVNKEKIQNNLIKINTNIGGKRKKGSSI